MNKNRYREIGSLSELRVEKLRLEYEIKQKQRDLDSSIDRFKYQFSFNGISNYIKNRLDTGLNFVDSVVRGYNFVQDLIGRFRSK